MLITGDSIVTMDPDRTVLEPGWVRVEGASITGLGAGAAPAGERVDHHGGLVMPGLVSAHQHVVDALLRGVEPGADFLDWLLGVYYGGLSLARPEDCGLVTEVVMAEMLCAGVTTVVDCWGVDGGDPDRGRVTACAEAAVAAHERSGARVLFAHMFAEHVPPSWRAHSPGSDLDRLCAPAGYTFDRVDALRAAVGTDRLLFAAMPELPELVSDDAFRAAFARARRDGVVLPVHLCASPASRAACGPEELDRLGVLGPELLGVHCIAVDDRDVNALAGAGVGIAHCPTANRMFPGGTTPVAAFRAAGAVVGVGLDNASLNPRIDLLAEARAAILAVRAGGATLTSADALAMATCDAATAIGMGDRIGSLQVGRRADLITMDTSGAHWNPRTDWASAVVWQSRTDDVRTVLVDGRPVVDDGVCVTLQPDRRRLDAAAARARDGVRRRGAAATVE